MSVEVDERAEAAEKALTAPMRRVLLGWYTDTKEPSGIITNGMWKRGLMTDRTTLSPLGIAVMKRVQATAIRGMQVE